MDGEYLDGVQDDVARSLAKTNAAGIGALRRYLASGEAVAFLGAGASAPLYPLWPDLISAMIDAAVDLGLPQAAADTCRVEAPDRPDSVIEIVSRGLGRAAYEGMLRDLFQVRRDPTTGHTWTAVHELVCRCAFKAVVTTNYDPGIVDARIEVRPQAKSSGYTTWQEEERLIDWRTDDIFNNDEMPLLYAHGHYLRPEGMVLATSDYARAYRGRLAGVVTRMIDAWHLVWIGFSFADQRISAILREVRAQNVTQERSDPPVRHVAVMAFDPTDPRDLATLAELARIDFGSELVLYPAPGGDHSALRRLLADFVDPRHPTVGGLAARAADVSAPAGVVGIVPVTWAQGSASRLFIGRTEELARLDRWAAEDGVRVVGVTAWGGAGKTALVSHWIDIQRRS